MRLGQLLMMSLVVVFIVLGSLMAFLFAHRYQVTSTHDQLFLVDTWSGDIKVYVVGGPYALSSSGKLKVHRIAKLLEDNE